MYYQLWYSAHGEDIHTANKRLGQLQGHPKTFPAYNQGEFLDANNSINVALRRSDTQNISSHLLERQQISGDSSDSCPASQHPRPAAPADTPEDTRDWACAAVLTGGSLRWQKNWQHLSPGSTPSPAAVG